MTRYDKPDWTKVVESLQSAETVVLACHVNPDGDALGSLLALTLGLGKLGKNTFATWGTKPLSVPPALAFLPGADQLRDYTDAPDAPVFVALDCGAAHRLGDLEAAARKSQTLINIDHHPGNEDFGTLNIVVTSASSTAEIVTRLLLDLDVGFDTGIATCLYTGVVTDTGRFQFSNSTPETLRLAANLLEFDVEHPAVAQEVYESAPFGYMKLLGHVLERATLSEDVRFIHSWFTRADLEETGVGPDETDSLIDAIRSTRDADVAAMFKEQADGRYRVSLRSKGPVSVGAIARNHGGGGHELAAGMTVDTVEAGVETILKELRAQVEH
ncbi:MAG: DHH family phosphoesterase [Actinomycetota bacterium]